MIFRRNLWNPVIEPEDLPGDPSSVFNPGAAFWEGETRLLLRVQDRGRETSLRSARSPNGVQFTVAKVPVTIPGIEDAAETVFHVFDPRLTPLEGALYVTLALDTDEGGKIALAKTDDLETFQYLGVIADGDVRNAVIFPEQVGGRYLMLSRPNRVQLPGGPTTGDEIVLSESDDLCGWREVDRVMRGRPHFWDEMIGSGPPPVKTRDGWLHIYHGVATHFGSANIYQAGAVLLDLDDPSMVVARSRGNILEPREWYELVGQVPNVVFPSGIIVEKTDDDGFADPDGKVHLYYGAADTSVGLATARLSDILKATCA